jgi:hypothetical protein
VLGVNLVFSASSFTERLWGGLQKMLRGSGGDKAAKEEA